VLVILGVTKVLVPVPPVRTAPPVGAANQSIVSPAPGVAEIFTVPVPQRDPSVPEGAAGFWTVTVLVAVAFEQPPVPVTVYVIVVVPVATPLIAPLVAFTVAMAVFADVHVPPAFPLEKNVVVPPEQTFCVPLNVPAFGGDVTVTFLVAVALLHPPVPVTV
jgi:hypothetical protein